MMILMQKYIKADLTTVISFVAGQLTPGNDIDCTGEGLEEPALAPATGDDWFTWFGRMSAHNFLSVRPLG
jgi:hypothetical protein